MEYKKLKMKNKMQIKMLPILSRLKMTLAFWCRLKSTKGSFLIELLVGTGMSLALFLVVAGALTWSRQQNKNVAGATEVSSTLLLVYQSIMNMRGDTPVIWNTVPKPADNEGGRTDKDVEGNLIEGNLIEGLYLHNRNQPVRPYGDETQVRAGTTDSNSRILDGVPAFLKDVYFITQQKLPIRITNSDTVLRRRQAGLGVNTDDEAQCIPGSKYNVKLVIEIGVFRQGYSPGQYAQATPENKALHRPVSVEKIQIPLVVYEHPDFGSNNSSLYTKQLVPRTARANNTNCPDSMVYWTNWIRGVTDANDDNCPDVDPPPPTPSSTPAAALTYSITTGREQKSCPYSHTGQMNTDGNPALDDPLVFVQHLGKIEQQDGDNKSDKHLYSYTYICRMSFRETIERYGSRRRFGGSFSCALDDLGDDRRYCQRPIGTGLARHRLHSLSYLRTLGECKAAELECPTEGAYVQQALCQDGKTGVWCPDRNTCLKNYCGPQHEGEEQVPSNLSDLCFNIGRPGGLLDRAAKDNQKEEEDGEIKDMGPKEKCGLCQYWEGNKDLAKDRGGPKGKKSCVEFCFNPNPITGNCSCPDGFRAHLAQEISKHLDTRQGDLDDNHYGFYQCIDIRGPMGGRDCPEDCQPRSNSCLQGTSWCKQRCR